MYINHRELINNTIEVTNLTKRFKFAIVFLFCGILESEGFKVIGHSEMRYKNPVSLDYKNIVPAIFWDTPSAHARSFVLQSRCLVSQLKVA